MRAVVRWFGSLQTTTKIGVSYSLLLAIIVLEMLIGYAALSIVWDANQAIQFSAEAQRLTMTMGRNWEAARRLQREFFLQSEIVGPDQAYQVYALASGSRITEVIRDGAAMKRLIAAPDASTIMRERDQDLNQILVVVGDYASQFEAISKLQLEMESTSASTQAERAAAAARLHDVLARATESQELFHLLYATRYWIEQGAELDTATASALAGAPAELRRAIDGSSLTVEERATAHAALADYERLAGEMAQIEREIARRLGELTTLGDRVDPSLVTLMAAVTSEAAEARTQIEATRSNAIAMLAATVIVGMLTAIAIGVLLHYSVTRKITALTTVASALQAGDLSARAPVDSTDELGQLAATLNEMAATLGLTIDRLDIVRRATLDLSSELDVDAVTVRALDVALNLSRAEVGLIALVDDDHFLLAQSFGLRGPAYAGAYVSGESGIVGHVARNRQTAIWREGDPQAGENPLLPADYAQLAIPLLSGQHLYGILALAGQGPAYFASDIVRLLELYAGGAAVAIHNALLYGDVQQLAVADALTGLFNRRGLAQHGTREIERALRHERPVAAILLDIDYFKQFNDRYSYEVGDLVLCAIADCLRANVRRTDLICRYGGEEFLLLLPEMDQSGAVTLARRLRDQVEASKVQTAEGALSVTVSLGVAVYVVEQDPAASEPDRADKVLKCLIDQADRMLHAAKVGGRNRVAAEPSVNGPGPADLRG